MTLACCGERSPRSKAVAGGGAAVEVVSEPGGAGETRRQLTAGSLLGGPVEGADGARESGVEAVALGERDLQEVGQLLSMQAVGRVAEYAHELIGGRAK